MKRKHDFRPRDSEGHPLPTRQQEQLGAEHAQALANQGQDASEPTPAQTLNLTPTWETAARIFAAVLENGTPEGKSSALEGLLEMGRILDQFNQGVSRKDIQAARRAENV